MLITNGEECTGVDKVTARDFSPNKCQAISVVLFRFP